MLANKNLLTVVFLWVILRLCPYLDHTESNGRATDEERWIGKDLKKSSRWLIEEISRRFLEGLRKIRKDSVRTASVPAEIRAEHLPNTGEESYRYAKPPGSSRKTTYDILTLQDTTLLKVPNILNRWWSYMLSLDVSGLLFRNEWHNRKKKTGMLSTINKSTITLFLQPPPMAFTYIVFLNAMYSHAVLLCLPSEWYHTFK
jgi:hypothetical protein